MKLNKKVIESMTVAATLAVMSTFTAFAGSTEDNTGDAPFISASLDKNGTAGIIVELNKMGSSAVNESGLMTASIVKTQNNVVTASEDEAIGTEASLADTKTATAGIVAEQGLAVLTDENTAVLPEAPEALAEVTDAPAEEEAQAGATDIAEALEPTETPEQQPEAASEPSEAAAPEEAQTPEDAEWANRLMANVDEDMNIRTQPGEDAELAGKLFRGDVAEVVAVEGDWTQISSGNVTGYVKNEYCVYGGDAEALANEVCTTYATVNAGGLRLRSEPSEASSIVTTAAEGDKLEVAKETAADGWVPVQVSDTTAYVSSDYVSVELNLGTALNSEEIAAKEAEKAEEERKKQNPAVSANTDEVTLLGALIQCEAGSGSYEGMVAVGSVVMNRVRSGAYPGTISGVVYQSGQFPPALNGSVANVAAGGVKSSCIQAAREALSGADITNGALSFRSASSGAAGTVIGANVFF